MRNKTHATILILVWLVMSALIAQGQTTVTTTAPVVALHPRETVVALHEAIVAGDVDAISTCLRDDTQQAKSWKDALMKFWSAKSELARSADEQLGGMSRLVLSDEFFVLEESDRIEFSLVGPMSVATFPMDRGTMVLRWHTDRWLVDFESAAMLGEMKPHDIARKIADIERRVAAYRLLRIRVEGKEFKSPNGFLAAFNKIDSLIEAGR